jgi:mannose-1-phosphate guanylyltransferase/phosphomannomutase
VEGAEPENHALAAALTALGCRVEKGWRVGVPAFRARHGGFRLSARDERGCLWEDGQLLALVVLIEMENGGGQAAVPPGASAAAELVAAGYGGTVLRGEAGRSLAARQPWMREGASAAVRICSRMARSGEKLWELLAMTPRFSAWKREIPLTARRAQVMEALAKEGRGGAWGEGLRLRMGGGYVSCTPLARREALRVLAEGPDLELAAELCDQYAAKIARLDRALSKQSSQESRPKE